MAVIGSRGKVESVSFSSAVVRSNTDANDDYEAPLTSELRHIGNLHCDNLLQTQAWHIVVVAELAVVQTKQKQNRNKITSYNPWHLNNGQTPNHKPNAHIIEQQRAMFFGVVWALQQCIESL